MASASSQPSPRHQFIQTSLGFNPAPTAETELIFNRDDDVMTGTNNFTNARIESFGNVQGVDDDSHDVFKVEGAGQPVLYGDYFHVFQNNGYDFNIEIGVFGYVSPNNIGNPRQGARQHFSPEESDSIEQLVRSVFLSNPEHLYKKMATSGKILGGRSAFARTGSFISLLYGSDLLDRFPHVRFYWGTSWDHLHHNRPPIGRRDHRHCRSRDRCPRGRALSRLVLARHCRCAASAARHSGRGRCLERPPARSAGILNRGHRAGRSRPRDAGMAAREHCGGGREPDIFRDAATHQPGGRGQPRGVSW